ncbi:MAG TPA: FAD-dependent oxidoreductase [Polyangiaceae bacterium]|nr:FAD-dependent oxidoreductase [Polyangiaceae bacterium]
MARKRYVVIGEGAAGLTAVEELRRLDAHAVIGLFSDEPYPAYFRAALTNYLLGELREDQLFVQAPDFFQAARIRRALTRVVAIDPKRGLVWDAGSAQPTPFDALLVASGAYARPPTFEGGALPGVVTLRTLYDARVVMEWLRLGSLKSAVILGAGPLGLEWAHALLEHRIQVTIIERGTRLLASALDEVASDLLAARLRQAGVQVIFADEVVRAYAGPSGSVAGVVLRSGQQLACGLVAAALGVVPNTGFLSSSGLKLTHSGALAVDATLRSSEPNVWGAGDVVSVNGQSLALWEPAKLQGRLAARNMVGGRMQYEPGTHYFATRLFDLDFARLGSIDAAPTRDVLVDLPRGTGKIAYRKLVFEQGKLIGALMMGERSERVRALGRTLKRLIDQRIDVSSIRDALLTPEFDLSGWLDRQKRVAQPTPGQKTQSEIPLEAKLRGTQGLALSQLTQHVAGLTPGAHSGGNATGAMAMPTPSGGAPFSVFASPSNASSGAPVGQGPAREAPRATRMLSIGLPAELAQAQPKDVPSRKAYLEYRGSRRPIERRVVRLGADAHCELLLDAAGVEGMHAELCEYAGSFYVQDLGTRAGTWLNARPVTSAERLRTGDRLRIGAAELVFQVESEPKEERSDGATPPVPRGDLVAAPRLLVQSGAKIGHLVRLAQRPCLIGRSPACDLSLNEPFVAPEHARVFAQGSEFFLEPVENASALDPRFGTWLQDSPLYPGQRQLLTENSRIRIGSVELAFTRAALPDAAGALMPGGRVVVDSGPDLGKTQSVGPGLRIGSGPEANFVLQGLPALVLEIAPHEREFFARDLSRGHALRAGRSLGDAWVALSHGEQLLLGGSVLLRFEEV